jgi:cytochrome b involved in lipid metabolism
MANPQSPGGAEEIQKRMHDGKPIPDFATYTMEDVAKHNTKADCWLVIDGIVLDLTDYLKKHPGGPLSILPFKGGDATRDFLLVHPRAHVETYATKYIVGELPKPGGVLPYVLGAVAVAAVAFGAMKVLKK